MVIFLLILIVVLLVITVLVIYSITKIATVSETTREIVSKDEIEHNDWQFQASQTEQTDLRPEQNSNLTISNKDPYFDNP